MNLTQLVNVLGMDVNIIAKNTDIICHSYNVIYHVVSYGRREGEKRKMIRLQMNLLADVN